MTAEPVELKRGTLGLADVLFQGITHIGPAVGVIFTLPFIASYAGAAMPISLLGALVVCFFIANTVAQFSRYMPSSGGYYAFVSRGLGPRWGFMAAWSYFIYDPLGPAAVLGFLGYLSENILRTNTNIDIPWWIFALISVGVVWLLTYLGVGISTRTAVILGSIELLIMVALGVTFLLSPAHGSSATAPLNPASAPTGLSGILYGIVFSILALSGFESAAPLAQETRQPAQFISRAIMWSLLIVGVFYLFSAYTASIGWGTGDMKAFASNANPYYALAHKLWGAGWILVFFAIINSSLAIGIASTNAVTRVMYTMARAKALPRLLRTVHPVRRTPTAAIHLQQIVTVVLILGIGNFVGPSQIYGWLGAIITVGIIVMYGLANISLTRYIRREHPQDFRRWNHQIMPALGTLLLLPVLWVTFWPIPAYPFNLVPYIVVVWLIIGFVMLKRLEAREPDALVQASTLLVTPVDEPRVS